MNNTQKTQDLRGHDRFHIANTESRGHKKLWAAVVAQATEDARVITKNMSEQMETYGVCDEFLAEELRLLYYDIRNEWFYEICEFVDQDPEQVYEYVLDCDINQYNTHGRITIDHDEFCILIGKKKPKKKKKTVLTE
jgi:hypothetical protein